LTSVSEFKDIELDNSGDVPVGKFMAKKDFDVDAKLNELAMKASKLKDWSREN
jgi:hypothetical protein